MHEGGGVDYLKYLKGSDTEKRGGENKDFKKGEQTGSRGGCLKREGGGWNPLRTMVGFQKGKCIGSSRLAVSSGAVDVYDIFVIC